MFVTFISGSMGMFMFKNLGEVKTEEEAVKLVVDFLRPNPDDLKEYDVEERQEVLNEFNEQLRDYDLDQGHFMKGEKLVYEWNGFTFYMVGDEGQDVVIGTDRYIDMNEYNVSECNGYNCIEEIK